MPTKISIHSQPWDFANRRGGLCRLPGGGWRHVTVGDVDAVIRNLFSSPAEQKRYDLATRKEEFLRELDGGVFFPLTELVQIARQRVGKLSVEAPSSEWRSVMKAVEDWVFSEICEVEVPVVL